MPNYKRYQPKYLVRSSKKKQRKYRGRTSGEPALIPLQRNVLQTGFPNQVKVRLKYVDTILLTSNVGAPSSHTFRMNSLFDPDLTGTGHQPYGFDQWSPLYTTYTVVGAKLRADWSPVSQSDITAVRGPWNVLTVTDDDGSISSTNPTLNMELPRCDSKILGDKQGAHNVVTTYATYSPLKDLGISPNDDVLNTLMSTNPGRVWFATCSMNDISTNSSQLQLKVTIEFMVVFKNVRNQGQS